MSDKIVVTTLSIIFLFIMTISILPRQEEEVKITCRQAIELTDGTMVIIDN